METKDYIEILNGLMSRDKTEYEQASKKIMQTLSPEKQREIQKQTELYNKVMTTLCEVVDLETQYRLSRRITPEQTRDYFDQLQRARSQHELACKQLSAYERMINNGENK